MPGSLSLYRFVEDAWAGGLRGWCGVAPEFGAGGVESWLVLENAGQFRWVLRNLGIVPDGLKVVDGTGLRALLAQGAGLEPPLAHGATAGLVGKVATGRPAGPSGALERSTITPGAFDLRLRERAAALPVRLCWLGWDAAHWEDFGLVETVSARAVSSDFFLPSPRLPADGVQREWIEKLERKLRLERVICQEGGFPAGNEALVSRLERSGLGGPAAAPPQLLVGREWHDQVRAVSEEVASWAGHNADPARPLGIIAPAGSVTAAAVGERLAARGLRVEQPGRARELPGPLLIVEQIARYHLQGQDMEELIELASLLYIHLPEPWAVLAPEGVYRGLAFAFRAAQSRNARILASALPGCGESVWGAICQVIRILGKWEGEATWAGLRGRWEEVRRELHLPAGVLEPLWSRTESLFQAEPVPARLFMEWLAGELGEMRRERAQPDHAALAPVVITTFAEAAQQTWGRLIFLDSNEHAWPESFPEEPSLGGAAQGKLRLSPRDRWALDQARFLDLVEHCAGEIAFAGVALGPSGAREAQPNEWVLRALLECAKSPLETWAEAARTYPAEPASPLPAPERVHLAAVHASRNDPLLPSDRFAFNLHESKLEAQAWSATRLDLAVTCPATFVLAELFGAESMVAGGFSRNEGQAVGSRAHRWLARILGGTEELRRAPPVDCEKKLRQELATSRRELEEWYAAEGLPLPLWWETSLQKTAWATRRCFRELEPLFREDYRAMEQRLDLAVPTDAGPLRIKGRVDILLSDQPGLAGARVRIFDFKTGRQKAPGLASLDGGEGHQFAAYYLMARAAGAASAAVGIIRQDEAVRTVFGDADEAALRARFGRLAELQRNMKFERRGPLVSEYGRCEELPLATAHIDPKVLEQKAGLPLLAQ